MRFGIGLSVQHLPDDPQAARFAEHVASGSRTRRCRRARVSAWISRRWRATGSSSATPRASATSSSAIARGSASRTWSSACSGPGWIRRASCAPSGCSASPSSPTFG